MPCPVDAEEHFLGQVLGLVRVADEVVHDADEPVPEPLDHLRERAGVVVPDPDAMVRG